MWPLSRLWSLKPLKQRLGPERRPADCDRGWKTGWHGAVYPSPPAPPGKEAQTLWGEGICAPCSAGLSHCLHPWFSPWGGTSLPHHATNREETHSLAPCRQGGWGGCWWVPRPLSSLTITHWRRQCFSMLHCSPNSFTQHGEKIKITP